MKPFRLPPTPIDTIRRELQRDALTYMAVALATTALPWAIAHLLRRWIDVPVLALVAIGALAGQRTAEWAVKRRRGLRRALADLDALPPARALDTLCWSGGTGLGSWSTYRVDATFARHLRRLCADDIGTIPGIVHSAILDGIRRCPRSMRGRGPDRKSPAYILAHIHAAAAIGGQRYVQPLADLAAIRPRNAGEEEVRAAAAEALRVVQARLGEANDHLLRPADAPGETLLRPAEAAGTEALLRAVEGERRKETSG